MTTLRTLVTDGLRESGILQVGADPEADEFQEGFRRLTNIISSIYGAELGDLYTVINLGSNNLATSKQAVDYLPYLTTLWMPSNVRAVLNLNGPESLYLDPNPNPGARLSIIDASNNLATNNLILNGNGRLIENLSSVTLNTSGMAREWFYRDDLGSWQRVVGLAENDQSPFPAEFDDFLIIMLAMRLNPRYGADTKGESVERLKDIRNKFRARYRQTREMYSEAGLVRASSSQARSRSSGFTSFETGINLWN